jgi:uncharacterized protein YndB with AHSA1/START domain
MAERSVTHADFTIERTYRATPEKVYQAFADPEVKKQWFKGPDDWRREESTYDFRVGGHETSVGGPKDGWTSSFRAMYLDIIPNERIIYSYDMDLDGKEISASLAVLEFKPEGDGTKLILTEHGAYLDGWDNPDQRRHGTEELLENLAKVVEK